MAKNKKFSAIVYKGGDKMCYCEYCGKEIKTGSMICIVCVFCNLDCLKKYYEEEVVDLQELLKRELPVEVSKILKLKLKQAKLIVSVLK